MLDVLLLVALLVVLDELGSGVVPPPGPRLVSWTMPQITTPSITAISPNQAISTDRRRNHGVGASAATLGSVVGSSSKGLYEAYWVGALPGFGPGPPGWWPGPGGPNGAGGGPGGWGPR